MANIGKGAVCSHGQAVLVCHVNDGSPCTDYHGATADRYKIVRYRRSGRNRVIMRGLTLAEAQEHCSDPKTAGDGWFDSYSLDNGS